MSHSAASFDDSFDDCTFCSIVAGSSPAEVVYEDAATFAFMDALPMTPGHVLLVPKQHVRDLFELPHDEGGALLRSASVIANRLTQQLGAVGVNLLNNNGHAADQSQFHLHFHLIPRYGNDRLLHPWERRYGQWSEIRAVAEKLRGTTFP
jgi:histidine triad (HIT) family protein